MKLDTCWTLRQKFFTLQERLEMLRGVTLAPRRLDGCRTKNPVAESHPEKLTRLICDGEQELEKLRVEMENRADELAAEIFQRVTDVKAARILLLRYVDCLPFAAIVASTHYSRSHVFNLHRIGKSAFEAVNC